jgi:hypothetical protein
MQDKDLAKLGFVRAIDPFSAPSRFQPVEKIKISKPVAMAGNSGKHRFSRHQDRFHTRLRPDLDRRYRQTDRDREKRKSKVIFQGIIDAGEKKT